RLQVDHGEVAAALEGAFLVENVGDAARHAGGEVAARRTDHHHHAAGHVLAAVVAGPLDDGHGAGVPNRKTLAGDAAEVALPGDGAVEHGIADDDAFFWHDAGAGIGPHDQLAAGEALADVVVGLAHQIESDAMGEPGAEALPGRALEGQPDGVLRQPAVVVASGNLAREHGPGRAIAIADGELVL